MLTRFLALALTLAVPLPASAEDTSILVASTTSTEQSGLFGHLLPAFTAKTGIQVKVVALGTGQALDIGRRGDADVVFVHDREAEEKFVAEGHGIERRDVMHNDFVLVGPRSDPARAAGRDVVAALRSIASAKTPFVSRGDPSGTHAAELRAWKEAGIAPQGEWYREIGQGMGPTLNMASAQAGYTLADRGTWLSFKNRGELAILVEHDARLANPYGHAGQSTKASEREGGRRAGLHRLAGLARGAEEDRRLHHRRRAAVLPGREGRSLLSFSPAASSRQARSRAC